MEIKADQYAVLEDNEDGTSTMRFRVKLGDSYHEETFVLDTTIATYFESLMPMIPTEANELMEKHATRVPGSAELA